MRGNRKQVAPNGGYFRIPANWTRHHVPAHRFLLFPPFHVSRHFPFFVSHCHFSRHFHSRQLVPAWPPNTTHSLVFPRQSHRHMRHTESRDSDDRGETRISATTPTPPPLPPNSRQFPPTILPPPTTPRESRLPSDVAKSPIKPPPAKRPITGRDGKRREKCTR